MIRMFRSLAALWVVALATACGGGGGDAGDNPLGGGNGGTPDNVAADLTLELDATSLPNNGTDVVTAKVTAVDANRNALPGIAITMTVDSDAVATVSDSETDDRGVVSAEVSIGANKSNRVITVTAVSGEISRTASFQVTGARLTATLLPAVLQPGQDGQIEFRLTDVTTNAMVGQEILIAGADGVETSGTTGPNGEFLYEYQAPADPGPLEIRASAGGTSVSANVDVQAGTGTVPVAVGPVQARSISVNPSVVSVNTSGTTNRSEVRALFLRSGNAPIRNIRVRFDLNGDPLSVGGTFTAGTSVVYSDASGVATTAYVPGDRSSPPDGVTIRACWDYADFAAGTCPNSVTKTLTVVSEPLSVSIGTNDRLEVVDESSLVYTKRFVVQVVDAAGQAKADVQISAPVDLLRYGKGFWEIDGDQWVQILRATCDNEDLNRNGSIDVYSNGANEDANGTVALEPRKADVSVSFEGSSRTNSSGQVVLRLTYPQNVASWVDYNLVVSAAGVAGSEGKANFLGTLPVLASEVNDTETDVPFRLSPYGVQTSPTTLVTTPGPDVRSGMLCTNPN